MLRLDRLPVLQCIGLVLGPVLVVTSEANVDKTVDNIGLYGGGSTPINPNSTIVEIKMNSNSGVWVYGDAQTATNWTGLPAPSHYSPPLVPDCSRPASFASPAFGLV
jgi:hypothetical protein